ncbi:MAG: serine/threonine protein kinase [Planctomycetes bacterium]|nr:serine/threonine protein kinase [Planctomycetota bacterium]
MNATTKKPSSPAQHPGAPKTIGRFTLLRPHGRGHAGVVYQAEETLANGMKRPVAVKILRSPDPSDSRYMDKFEREALALLEFGSHPHIVGIVECGRLSESEYWIAMEWMPQCLQDRIGDDPTSEREVARMIHHVARGLHHLHTFETAPVLHRDIKPRNILVTGEGEHATYRIADLELAGHKHPNLPSSAESVRFIAPEFCPSETSGKPHAVESPASDIYSLGFVAYSMLLGARRFADQFPELTEDAATDPTASVAGWMQWHVSPNLEVAPAHEVVEGVSRELSEIIRKMMAKPLDQRYQSAQEVLDALGELGGEESTLATPPSPAPSRRGKRWKKHRKTIALCGLALIAIGCGAWIELRPRPFLELPDGSSISFQGPAGELRVRAGNAPADASVEVELEGATTPLHAALERDSGSQTRGFDGSVKLSAPRTALGVIRLLDAHGRPLCTAQASFTREPPVHVVLKTEPARPSFPLTISFSDGSRQTVTADSEGRVTFDADPQALSLAGQDSRFVLASESASLRVTPGTQQPGALRLISRLGALRITVKPIDARVTIERPGVESEEIPLTDGSATVEREVGEWTIRAAKDGFQPARRAVEISRVDTRSAELQLAQLPPPPAPAVPEPPPLDSIERSVRSLAPLAQLTLTQVPLSGKVRLQGPLLNQRELDLLTKRLEPVADSLLWETRVDPANFARELGAGLRNAGYASVDVRVIEGGQRLWIRLARAPGAEESAAKALIGTYFLDDGQVSLRFAD